MPTTTLRAALTNLSVEEIIKELVFVKSGKQLVGEEAERIARMVEGVMEG